MARYERAGAEAMAATPILFDCDPGHDDAIALVMAHRSPAIELLGVTTTCGNAEIEKTTANCLRILEFIGAGDVPGGRRLPSPAGAAAWCWEPRTVRADSRVRLICRMPRSGPSTSTPSISSPSKLAAHPEPTDVVATGPLSNIGLLILKHRRCCRRSRS